MKEIKLSMRMILLIAMLSQVLIVALVVSYLSFKSCTGSIKTLVNRSYIEANNKLEEKINHYFNPPIEINIINESLITEKAIDFHNQEDLINHFKRIIEIRPTVNSVYFANMDGGLANAGRDKKTNEKYIIFTEEFKSGPFKKYGLNSDGSQGDLVVELPKFDARTRPWFDLALNSDDVVWSEVYMMATGDDLGITASKAIHDTEGNIIGVLGVDLFLTDISSYLSQLGIIGSSFIMEDSGYLIASSNNANLFSVDTNNKVKTRIYAKNSESQTIKMMANELCSRYENLSSLQKESVIEFKANGERFLIHVTPFKVTSETEWLIVSGASEKLFLAEIRENNKKTKRYIIIALVITILFALIISKLLSDPIHDLDAKIHKISSGKWLSKPKSYFIKEIDALSKETFKMNEALEKLFESLNDEIAIRKETEKLLNIAKDNAEESNRLKSSFLANMSHELRTPLSGVLGFSEILGETELNEEQLEMVNVINFSGKRLLSTLNMILDLSRIEANSKKVDVSKFSLKPVIEQAVMLFRPVAEKKNVVLKFVNHLIYDEMNSDIKLIEHIVNELINNAIKYTDSGTITVTSSSEQDDMIKLQVKDSGIGIPENKYKLIFEAFRQVSEGWDRNYDGSGLGLTLCKKYSEFLGGSISVESSLGKGTTFTVIIPREVVEN